MRVEGAGVSADSPEVRTVIPRARLTVQPTRQALDSKRAALEGEQHVLGGLFVVFEFVIQCLKNNNYMSFSGLGVEEKKVGRSRSEI